MENKSHAFWAGLFTIGLMIAIAGVVFWFNIDRVVRVPYDLIAHTNVTGLFPDAAVRYRGLGVGRVQSIRFDHAHAGQIIVRILVDKNAPMTTSTFGTLGFQGVTGIAFVQLDDTGGDLTPLVSSEERVARVPMRASLFDQLQERGDLLLSELERVAAHADNMLSDDMRSQLKATATSLQHAADGVATLARQAGPAAEKLPETLVALDRTLASMNRVMTTLNASDGPVAANLNKIGAAAQRADATLRTLSVRLNDETLPRVDALAADAAHAARSVQQAADVVGANPASVLFGAPGAAPGPGEPGFQSSQKAAATH